MSAFPKLSIVPAILSCLFVAPSAVGQVVFTENFRSPSMPGTDGQVPCNTAAGGAGSYLFPVGWLLRNVDNGAPAAAVSYVNEAWEVREDFIGPEINNCVAFSTSWYDPANTANDFMWSPQINVPAAGAALSWRARAPDAAYRDGYEVRVMPATAGPPTGGTGIIGNQITASTVVFSTAAEETAWTTRTVSLQAFAGQGIYVGFRNNSNNKFLLLVDDVSVTGTAPDLAAQAPARILPYTQVPASLGYTPTLGVNGANVGGAALTNISASAQLVRNGVDVGAPVVSSTAASLAIGATTPLTFSSPTTTLSVLGDWSVRYLVTAAESENPAVLPNNTIVSAAVAVNATDLARHEGQPSSTLGIGAGNGGELGVQFTIPTGATFAGVRFSLGAVAPTVDDGAGGTRPSTWAGRDITANLRSIDTATNRPGALIDTTVAGVTAFAATTYNLAFSGGPRTLAPGTYVVTVNEPVATMPPGDTTMPVLMHVERFQPGTVWVNWPTSPTGTWANVESFGAAFARTPNIILTTSLDLLSDGFESPPAPTATRASGSAASRSAAEPGGLRQMIVADPGLQ